MKRNTFVRNAQYPAHTTLSIQLVYDAMRVYTLGKRVAQLIPNDMIPTMVDIPDATFMKIGPPEAPTHASAILSGGEDISSAQS